MKRKTEKSKELVQLGNKIREQRRKLGMTLEGLAEKINRSDKQVRSIEKGRAEPKIGTLLLICEACEIDVGELKAFIPREDISYV